MGIAWHGMGNRALVLTNQHYSYGGTEYNKINQIIIINDSYSYAFIQVLQSFGRFPPQKKKKEKKRKEKSHTA